MIEKKLLVYSLFLTFLFLTTNCNLNKTKLNIFTEEDIEMIWSDNDTIVPYRFSGYSFYFRGNRDTVVVMEYRDLKKLQQIKTKEYILKLLNQKEKINTQNQTYFILNSEMSNIYTKNNLENFIQLYSEKVDTNRYRLNYQFQNNHDFETLSYFLFINGFFIIKDGYSGFSYVVSKEQIFFHLPSSN